MKHLRGVADTNDILFASMRTNAAILFVEPCPIGGKGKINPHVTRFGLDDGRLIDVFHVKPIYYEAQLANGRTEWRPLSEICVHHGNRNIVLETRARKRMTFRYRNWLARRCALLGGALTYGYRNALYWGVQPYQEFAADTLEAFPDPDPETASVDGYATFSNANWDTAHDATSGDTAADSATNILVEARHLLSGSNFRLSRGFFLFDTSTIGSAAGISSATLDLYINTISDEENDGDDYIRICDSTPASNTAIITGDFDQCGSIDNPTALAGDIDLGSLTATQYNAFTLNPSGISAIAKTGITKLGAREGHDVIDSPISGGAGTDNFIGLQSADATGTTQDPKLTVTYTLGRIMGALAARGGLAGEGGLAGVGGGLAG